MRRRTALLVLAAAVIAVPAPGEDCRRPPPAVDGLPFGAYYFLLVFRPGGGGLEHKNSMLATTQTAATKTDTGSLRWLNFMSHEYCHAFNVKRLRPVELGPFDYEHEPHTTSLWISEGFTRRSSF